MIVENSETKLRRAQQGRVVSDDAVLCAEVAEPRGVLEEEPLLRVDVKPLHGEERLRRALGVATKCFEQKQEICLSS